MAYNVISIMKTIRDNASAEYQARIPIATQSTLTSVGNIINTYTPTRNEFLGALVNRIAMVVIETKSFKNPLSVLKKGGVPLGQDIEHLYTNPVTSETYTYDSSSLLSLKKSDTKATFYRMNRQDKYPVTITQQMLALAFTSETEMSKLIDMIINSLYSGDSIDEFILMKKLIKNAYDNSHLLTVEIYDENATTIDDEITSKELIKQVKRFSNLMTFPSSNYNKYTVLNSADTHPVVTWTELKDQILIIDSVVASNVDVEVLAYAFNLEKSQIQTQSLNIDNFGGAPILAILCDKSFFQVYDNHKEMTSFYNPDNLSIKYMLHHWQTYGYSLFANAVAFTYKLKTV